MNTYPVNSTFPQISSFLIFLLTISLVIPTANAQNLEVGDNDFQITNFGTPGDPDTTSDQPEVAYNSTDNEFLVVWTSDDRTSGAFLEILGQRLNENGNPIGGPITISQNIPSASGLEANQPDVAYNSTDNEYLVTWVGIVTGGASGELEIFVRRLDNTGAAEPAGSGMVPISDLFGFNTSTPLPPTHPSIAYNSDNNEYLVVWASGDNTAELDGQGFEILGQRLSSSGGEIGSNDFRISSSSGTASVPHLTFNSRDNEYLVVWTDTNFLASTRGQRIAGNGAEVGDNDFLIGGDNSVTPDVAHNSSVNEYLVVFRGVGGSREIHAQRLSASGSELGADDFAISDTPASESTILSVPRVEFNMPGNNYLVTWSEGISQGANPPGDEEIYGQVIANNGTEAGPNDFRISDVGPEDDPDSHALDHSLIFNSTDEEFLSVWSGNETPAALNARDREIYGQRLMSLTITDSDGDGVSDAQELIDGSDPNDASSFLFRLETTSCADWNGFLGMAFNIAEFTNFTAGTLTVDSTLFDLGGTAQSVSSFAIGAGAQTDLLVHDMPGFTIDSIGTVCSTVTSTGAQPGDADGRMLQYRPDGFGSFDFVLVMPFGNPLTGSQFVPYNTFHPSLDPADFGFFAANWLTVANTESSNQTGTVIMYAQDGTVALNVPVALGPDGRIDIPIHQLGGSLIGLVEWRPDDNTAGFRVTLNRYVYNGPTPSDLVVEAVSLQGVRGSKQTIIAPMDTRGLTAVLEVSNAGAGAANVNVVVNNSAGTEVLSTNLNLPGFSTQHFVLDAFLVNDLGLAKVTASSGAEMLVTAMQYGRTATAGISNIYPVPAREALGTIVQGTYNTFLNQGCVLQIGNVTGTPQNVTFDMTRFDGTMVLTGQPAVVPANGVFEFDLCSVDVIDVFGVVRINSTNANSTIAYVVRLGDGDNYRLATPAR